MERNQTREFLNKARAKEKQEPAVGKWFKTFGESVARLFRKGENSGRVDERCGDAAGYSFLPQVKNEERPRTPEKQSDLGSESPPRRMARMILAEATKVQAEEIRLETAGEKLRLTMDGGERPSPPEKLYSHIVMAFLAEANLDDWPKSQSGPKKCLDVELDWGGGMSPCVMESSDIAKELILRRQKGAR